MRGYPLATSCEDRPSNTGPVHVHRGGLLVRTPENERRTPLPMTWLPDRLYRIIFDAVRRVWRLQVEDDLRWATVAQVVVAPSGTHYVDVAATPDGAPRLYRHDTYLVRHHESRAGCRMTITPLGT